MCDCEFVCVPAHRCFCSFLPHLFPRGLLSVVGHGFLVVLVYWHTGLVIMAKLKPSVTLRNFVFNMK